jgi:RNA polymerase-associated protein CTR9
MMASLLNGHANGINGDSKEVHRGRFAEIPASLELPIYGEEEEAVELNLEDLSDDPTELCTLLESEGLSKHFWLVVALAYAKQGKLSIAIEVLNRGQHMYQQGQAEDKLALLSALTWMYLQMARAAPHRTDDSALTAQILSQDTHMDDSNRSDHYLQLATETINEATRISPSYPPLLLARGVLLLLRAHRTSGRSLHPEERTEVLRSALKQFDDALRASSGKSSLAFVGKARVLFLLGKYSDAYNIFQDILQRAPYMDDPDPRIGIGCCLWQLGHREEAKAAWERALEVNPTSVIAIQLMGLYWLYISSQFSVNDAQFTEPYKKAMTIHTYKALKMDGGFPLSNSTMASYFLMRKDFQKVKTLTFRALDRAEVDAIASDALYLLARESHQENPPNLAAAATFYSSADELRGGHDAGYLPAKFGTAQLKILAGDLEGAKNDLELLVQKFKSHEAMVILGTLYAEEVFKAQGAKSSEDKSKEHKKALQYLEQVRLAWRDSKKKTTPDIAVLLNLPRLYEQESPEKALQCLQQVEQMEIDGLPDDLKPSGTDDEAATMAALREHLSPQLLNNIGCFYYSYDNREKYEQAREMFQIALNATMRIAEQDPSNDADALVTTISYNLGRTYEALNEPDDAMKVYRGLLARHPDYTDANARLAYINFYQNPSGEGIRPEEMIPAVYEKNKENLEIRALYGLFLNRTKRRTMNISEDVEQRFYKRTLQELDKHDIYSLVAMGNINLHIAREMRRETEDEKGKRASQYVRAVEFFDKALQLDPKCANAAMGIGIAFAESKKDFPTAIQIFSKVRETNRDYSVHMNLGHVFTESGQYARAVESYEQALKKVDRTHRVTILMALGRVWLMRGKKEKSLLAMKEALSYSQQALDTDEPQIVLQFNVAFVQYQIAQLIFTLPVQQRNLEELENAANGLDDAIDAFRVIAKEPNPPYPRADIEQRANMGANTMKKQLERAIAEQKDYEEKNRERLEKAREARETEIRKREEEKSRLQEEMEEKKRKMQEERDAIVKRDREIAEARAEEERRKEEEMMTTDTETGEKKKREKRKRGEGKKKKSKKDVVETDGEVATAGEDDDGEQPRKKKKRRLERRSEKQSKYKSAEFIEDSDEEIADMPAANGTASGTEASAKSTPAAVSEDSPMPDEEAEELVVKPKSRKARVVDDDEDEGEPVGDVSMGDAAGVNDEDE